MKPDYSHIHIGLYIGNKYMYLVFHHQARFSHLSQIKDGQRDVRITNQLSIIKIYIAHLGYRGD